MKPIRIDIDPANVDADGIADGNSSAGATVTIDGALASGGTFTSSDGLGRQLVILDLGADIQTGATYTITGTDSDGRAQVESLAGPGASASVETTLYFQTVSSIAIASPVAGSTVDIGTVDEVASKTVRTNFRGHNEATYSVDVTGTVNFTVQELFEEIETDAPQSNGLWFSLSALTSKTADTVSVGTVNAAAARVIVNSYTDTAELQFVVIQGT
jgi:hypothetical protein